MFLKETAQKIWKTQDTLLWRWKDWNVHLNVEGEINSNLGQSATGHKTLKKKINVIYSKKLLKKPFGALLPFFQFATISKNFCPLHLLGSLPFHKYKKTFKSFLLKKPPSNQAFKITFT